MKIWEVRKNCVKETVRLLIGLSLRFPALFITAFNNGTKSKISGSLFSTKNAVYKTLIKSTLDIRSECSILHFGASIVYSLS
ncbi:unnamed protein product [Blepharisma stoltei]|uniref:Uncharacterized protein n=1 Tax=Blepharisma stoltei TaxID=1481888 RepID=A0AAU9IEG8_9CILI|nr:unnamed protein product [Blepharisma stoltei]